MTLLTTMLYLTCAMTAVNSVVLILWWFSLRKTRAQGQASLIATQRLNREISQHRYALALLPQLYGQLQQNQRGQSKTDEELLDAAMLHLDELAAMDNPGDTPVIAPKPVSEASVKGLNDNEILQFIKKAIQTNSLTIHQQPIVSLPARTIKYYEVFARILVDNGFIPAKNFVAVAKDNNLMWAIDNLLLLRCLQLINKNPGGLEKELFINVSAQTFANKKYMSELIEFLAANPKFSSKLIFEMTQDDSIKLTSATRHVMENLSLLGCRFSMDQVTFLGMDMNRLMDQHISFVKLDAANLAKEAETLSGRKRIKKIKASLDSQGITVILEKVEDEKQLFNIIDLHANYGQGYLFGAPVALQ